MVDARLGSKCTSDSNHPCWLFLRETNTTLPTPLNVRIVRYPWSNMKSKINFSHHFQEILGFSPPHSTHCSSFSLYSFMWLSYTTGYCFTFSNKRPTEPTFKEGEESKVKKKGHILKRSTNFFNFFPTIVGSEEYFAILESLKCLFRHFFSLLWILLLKYAFEKTEENTKGCFSFFFKNMGACVPRPFSCLRRLCLLFIFLLK